MGCALAFPYNRFFCHWKQNVVGLMLPDPEGDILVGLLNGLRPAHKLPVSKKLHVQAGIEELQSVV